MGEHIHVDEAVGRVAIRGHAENIHIREGVAVLGGSAAMRFGGSATAKAETAPGAAIHVSGGGSVRHGGKVAPATSRRPLRWARRRRSRTGIAWNEWEFGTIEFGALVGGLTNAATGNQIGYPRSAIGGAIVTYVWGLWRWWDENRTH